MKRSQTVIAAAVAAILLAGVLPAFGQDSNPSPGWRKVGEPPTSSVPAPPEQAQQPQYPAGPQPQQSYPPPASQQYPAQYPAQQPGPPPQYQQGPPPQLPSQLTIPAGSWLTIRVNQPLSSDHNQPGDAFTGTLAQPVVVNGFVVARRGQTIAGRVAEAAKAGRVQGTSRLGLEVTELAVADGSQVPVRTQMVLRSGPTSVGADAAAIGTTTGMGAAIGAAAAGGFGAGMGAIAGAGASIIGVLVTRGRPTEVYPETLLTFRVEAPVMVATERAPDAYRPVMQEDYSQAQLHRQGPPQGPRYAAGPYPYYGYPYYGYPYYGPSFFYFSSPWYHGRGYYYHRR